MPKIKLFGFVLLAFTAVPAAARDCEEAATNMAEVRACIWEETNERLAVAFNQTLSHVRSRDAHSAELLVVAQQSWNKFASDSCKYTVSARQVDGMENDARLACWQTFIDARIRVLAAYRREFGADL